MPWETIMRVLMILSFMATVVIVGIYLYKRYQDFWRVKHIFALRFKPKPEETINLTHPTPSGSTEHSKSSNQPSTIRLYDLRRFRYQGFENLEKLDFSAFFIDENENEALGIFVSVSPIIMATLTKLEKALIHIDVAMSNADVTDIEIIDKVKIINDALSTLLDVTDNLTARLYEIYSSSSIETAERELNPEVVKAYIDIVHNMLGFAFDYLNVNNIIRLKVKEAHPRVERDFVRATERFLNIFFVDLMNCINMLDKSIEAYK